jgi:hypothetical protein
LEMPFGYQRRDGEQIYKPSWIEREKKGETFGLFFWQSLLFTEDHWKRFTYITVHGLGNMAKLSSLVARVSPMLQRQHISSPELVEVNSSNFV